MENLEAFKALIQSPKNVVIVTHFKPDADALGSSLGMAGFLRKKGHQVTVITPSDYPAFLTWMPGNEGVISISKESAKPEKKAKAMIASADIVFCLDFSSVNRINTLEESVRSA